MLLVGLFDRPASRDCLAALRAKPVIAGLTESIAELSDEAWRRAVSRLRAGRLLTPVDALAPDALDTHPLVREWFGERLRRLNEDAWKSAHGRLFEHLRDATKEGAAPTLSDLAPLYQAITHGCRAERYQEALDDVYAKRICRHRPDGALEFYSAKNLAAFRNDLAAISWFFVVPYEKPIPALRKADQTWVLNDASRSLGAQGRTAEALPTLRAVLRMAEDMLDWANAAVTASNLSQCELRVGKVEDAVADARQSVDYADRTGDPYQQISKRTSLGDALHAAGQLTEAEALFEDAERRQKSAYPDRTVSLCSSRIPILRLAAV